MRGCCICLVNMCRYLAPSSDIDWRMDGINGYKQPLDESHSKHMMGTTGIHKPNCSSSNVVQCFRVHGWHKNAQIWEWIARGGLRDLAGARFISLLVNAKADARCDGCPSLNTAPDMDDGTLCLFQYLFKLRWVWGVHVRPVHSADVTHDVLQLKLAQTNISQRHTHK